MNEVIREDYLKKLNDFRDDTRFVKIITGVRRCGKSTLLHQFQDSLIKSGVTLDNIITINFESLNFENILDYRQLYDYIIGKIGSERAYLLLDEIQRVNSWEKVINSLMIDCDVDIYITGSNAYLLSSELSTYLSGRYIELKMTPFSFKEFIKFNKFEDMEAALNNYIKLGGFPLVDPSDPDEKNQNILLGIYSTIVYNDIIQKNSIRDAALLENIVRFILSNSGNPTTSLSIANYLNENSKTIDNYLKMLEESFIIYRCERYDLKGKKLLKTAAKYYAVDTGLKNALVNFMNEDLGRNIENIVFLELCRRGYSVSVGKYGDYEVDFTAKKGSEIKHYQVTTSMLPEDVKNRELRSLNSLKDNYEKIIISLDKIRQNSYDGIRSQYLIDFLLE